MAKLRIDELKILAELMSDVARRIQDHRASLRAQYKVKFLDQESYFYCNCIDEPNV